MTVTTGKIEKKRCILLQFLAALTLVMCLSTVNVFADADKAQVKPKITVALENTESNIVVSDEDVYLYKIAGFTDYKTHEYTLESDFEGAASQLDFSSSDKTCSLENTQKLMEYISKNDIKPTAHSVSDAKGTAAFGEVDNGIYLVSFGENDAFSVSEFIVEAPMHGKGGYAFDVTASPKITPKPEDSTPDSSVPDTPSSGEKIPQTGQTNLPIPILLIVGTTLLVFGIVDGRRSRVENNEQ